MPCCQGGTRYKSSSSSFQMRLVTLAATAGVRCCHFLADPLPLVGCGSGRDRRRAACGRQKFIVPLAEGELVVEALFRLGQLDDLASQSGYMLANREIEPFNRSACRWQRLC